MLNFKGESESSEWIVCWSYHSNEGRINPHAASRFMEMGVVKNSYFHAGKGVQGLLRARRNADELAKNRCNRNIRVCMVVQEFNPCNFHPLDSVIREREALDDVLLAL